MTIAQAFNEWRRRYIEEPERFKREWKSIIDFQRAELVGDEPSYGDNCAAYLAELMQVEK